MKRMSKKFRDRAAEVREFRRALVAEIGICEICNHDPERVRPGNVAWRLHLHEIARGSNRSKALDKRFALLVLCWRCHIERVHGDEEWPEARQLAVLKKSRPDDYDLTAYNDLISWGPNRITWQEVQAWEKRENE